MLIVAYCMQPALGCLRFCDALNTRHLYVHSPFSSRIYANPTRGRVTYALVWCAGRSRPSISRRSRPKHWQNHDVMSARWVRTTRVWHIDEKLRIFHFANRLHGATGPHAACVVRSDWSVSMWRSYVRRSHCPMRTFVIHKISIKHEAHGVLPWERSHSRQTINHWAYCVVVSGARAHVRRSGVARAASHRVSECVCVCVKQQFMMWKCLEIWNAECAKARACGNPTAWYYISHDMQQLLDCVI